MGRQKDDGRGRLGGREKGSPNKITGSVKDWISSIIDNNRDKFEKDIKALDGPERVRVISNLLQYVTPKMQSVSPTEQIEAEYLHLKQLMEECPDEFMDQIVDRIKKLQHEKDETGED